jgi:hypothetical protein
MQNAYANRIYLARHCKGIKRNLKLNLPILGGQPKIVTEAGNEMKECSEMSSGMYCRVK